jgi:signal transduction histidine kinase
MLLFLHLMNLLQTLSYWGVTPDADLSNKRYVVISNRVSLLIAAFTVAVSFAGLAYFGLTNTVKAGFIFAILFIVPLIVNHLGFTNLSRIIISVIATIAAEIISLIDKIDSSAVEDYKYFEFRLIIICASLLPFILFKLSEKKYWLTVFVINFICIALYDPIHNVFNVGYYQLGLKGPNYLFLNVMFIASFGILSVGSYFLKISFERYELKNSLLIKKLSARQQEILRINELVDKQRKSLITENAQLNEELIDKNELLTETNQQLIKHNNDLQQFSYTVSHNLRGPIASLLGLLYLTDKDQLSEENLLLFEHIQKSVTTLDVTIKDLNNIIDIRNSISKVKQKVDLQEEIDHLINLLQKNIDDNKVEIQVDLSKCAEVYSVKPMLSSILYNLLSNSIKYRSENRKPIIKITSFLSGAFIKIQVTDNGLGIDVEKFKEKLFGLYKRFHNHVDGKGLGLFLVKLQAESLGGKVEIESTPGVGSTFSIYVPDVSEAHHQVVMDKEWGKLYYDAQKDIAMVIWKRALKPDELSEFFKFCVEFISTQPVANWIAEIKQGTKAENDDAAYTKARMQFANELKRPSLKRLGYVIAKANEPPHFEEYKKQLFDFYQGRIQFFSSMEEAEAWIWEDTQREQNAKKNSLSGHL